MRRKVGRNTKKGRKDVKKQEHKLKEVNETRRDGGKKK